MVLEHAPSWQTVLASEFEAPYMQNLKTFLRQQKDQHKKIYPHSADWFHALEDYERKMMYLIEASTDPALLKKDNQFSDVLIE